MTRVQERAIVEGLREVAEGTFELLLRSPVIASTSQPGQFVNVKAIDTMWGPYLRRPFSVSRVTDSSIALLFNVIGSGTRLLSSRRTGDVLDIVGPLGNPFDTSTDFETAVIVAGGLGVAPFPFLSEQLLRKRKSVITFLGTRTKGHAFSRGLENVAIATDDGSLGFHGTVVDLVEKELKGRMPRGPKLFGCGPTAMLRSLTNAAGRLGVPCEISLEGDMACGIGLCQGCPVERRGGIRKYALVCTEGPTFDCTEVVL